MKNKKNERLVVGYVRSAVKNDSSIKEQEKGIKDYCLKNGVKLAKVYVDNGCSGANLQRPALKELLTEVSTGKIQEIISYEADRLTRNRKDFLTLKALTKKYDVQVRTVLGIISNSNDLFIESTNEMLEIVNSFQAQLNKVKSNLYKQ